MYVNPNIFKAYDIRGSFPEEINAKAVYLITRSYVEFLRGKTHPGELAIVLGNDARSSSPELKKAVLEGLLEEGVSVIDIGYSTSPFHYYTVIHSGADGGIMVTASHDPVRMNGLKFVKKGGAPLNLEERDVVKNIAGRSIFQGKTGKTGHVEEKNYYREYIDFLLEQVDLSKTKDLHVVIDAGGGMTTVLLPYLLKKLPCKTTIINGEVFFYHQTKMLDPSVERDLAEVKNAVIEQNASFGVAFDQDGDRVGFVTHNARFFRADYVAAFFAEEFLKRFQGAKMVYDVRSSSIFQETIVKNGGQALESRVGHSFIKELMKKEDAFFAAEHSGHFYFKSFYYLDSDFLPLLYFLQFFAEFGKSSDDLLARFEIYPSSGELSFKVSDTAHLLEKIAGEFPDAKETKWIDGVSLYYDDWWANVRLSNTEPLVRLNVEARTSDILQEKVDKIRKILGS
ncbi:MAG: phosphomannomutase/phosphoglucomutase [Candidatus Ryanbacteria bacterium]|nr:phosphomannomutase/phosphoglucomutase [Candidatus Ryanbacteria bacterium]